MAVRNQVGIILLSDKSQSFFEMLRLILLKDETDWKEKNTMLGEHEQKFYPVRKKSYKIEFLSSANVIFACQSLQTAVIVFQE